MVLHWQIIITLSFVSDYNVKLDPMFGQLFLTHRSET